LYSQNLTANLARLPKDEEIADVLNYLRNRFGNKAGPISQSQVSRIRQGLMK